MWVVTDAGEHSIRRSLQLDGIAIGCAVGAQLLICGSM